MDAPSRPMLDFDLIRRECGTAPGNCRRDHYSSISPAVKEGGLTPRREGGAQILTVETFHPDSDADSVEPECASPTLFLSDSPDGPWNSIARRPPFRQSRCSKSKAAGRRRLPMA